MPSEEEVARWAEAIRRCPVAYRLPAYGPWVTVEHAARLFATWAEDEATDKPSPALCGRCGALLRYTFRPGQQLHDWCYPPSPEGPRPTLTISEGIGRTAPPPAISPAEALKELRDEWKRAKADPATSAEDLAALEALGRAMSVVDQVFTGRGEQESVQEP